MVVARSAQLIRKLVECMNLDEQAVMPPHQGVTVILHDRGEATNQ